MTTTPIATAAAAEGAATGAQGAAGVANPNGTLGQNDFLKLMIAQLQAQNPLSPANTNEFMSELAQFTQVEQLTNLANANELSGAVQLIGRTVVYSTPGGTPGSGTVTSAQSTASGTTVTVEGNPGIPLTAITEVR
jgi:flagellar basal-body rod modification protein FlgD